VASAQKVVMPLRGNQPWQHIQQLVDHGAQQLPLLLLRVLQQFLTPSLHQL
jgi:hypothetical protein